MAHQDEIEGHKMEVQELRAVKAYRGSPAVDNSKWHNGILALQLAGRAVFEQYGTLFPMAGEKLTGLPEYPLASIGR